MRVTNGENNCEEVVSFLHAYHEINSYTKALNWKSNESSGTERTGLTV